MTDCRVLGPGIFQYTSVIDTCKDIIKLMSDDTQGWFVENKDATEWAKGDTILGYDEYPINFSFDNNIKFLILAKNIYDYTKSYAKNNLTVVNNFEYCVARRYSTDQGFHELESPDMQNPVRKITSILFLNNIKEGGTLYFKNFDININPEEGKLVIFPSNFLYSFKINRPKDDHNFVIVSHFL